MTGRMCGCDEDHIGDTTEKVELSGNPGELERTRIANDIDIAIGFNDPAILVDACRCDPTVGYTCEMCFTHDTLAVAKRVIETLQREIERMQHGAVWIENDAMKCQLASAMIAIDISQHEVERMQQEIKHLNFINLQLSEQVTCEVEHTRVARAQREEMAVRLAAAEARVLEPTLAHQTTLRELDEARALLREACRMPRYSVAWEGWYDRAEEVCGG